MPKIIYKPPKSVVKNQIGTREKSSRVKKETKIFKVEPVKKKSKRRKGFLWTIKEKPRLLQKLKEHGSSNISLLKDPGIKKTPEQTLELIKHFKKGNRMVQVIKPQTEKDLIWVPKEIDNPIETWISLAETAQRKCVTANSMDCGHLLSDALSAIISEEKHPKPEDCQGVDYAQIYKFIYDLSNGDLPKEPNPETARKILEMANEVNNLVKLFDNQIGEEKSLLERFTLRDIHVLNQDFKIEDAEMEKLSNMPKINPLKISSSLFSKVMIRKESSQ